MPDAAAATARDAQVKSQRGTRSDVRISLDDGGGNPLAPSITRIGERCVESGQAARQLGIVVATVPRPTRMASAASPQERAVRPRLRTRHPYRSTAAPRGTSPSEPSASLSCTNGRRSVTRTIWPRVIQCASSAQHATLDLDAGRTQPLDPTPRHARIGVLDAANGALDARLRTIASAHGGVWPDASTAPASRRSSCRARVRRPAPSPRSRRAAGRPAASMPRAITSPVASSTITAPTAGLGAVSQGRVAPGVSAMPSCQGRMQIGGQRRLLSEVTASRCQACK